MILHSLLLSQQVCLGERRVPGVLDLRRSQTGQVVMLTLYPKNVAENIPADVLRQIEDEVDD